MVSPTYLGCRAPSAGATPTADQPTSFANGRYEVKRFLGEGGKKQVYLVQDTLIQRNDPGDREKAMSLLDDSLVISCELGMRPLMERVLSRREILKA